MPLSAEQTREIVEKYGQHGEDTGSAAVQVAILTRRIQELTEHVQEHPQDHANRRGLLTMVSKRRRLLDYLRDEDLERYRSLVEELDVRH